MKVSIEATYSGSVFGTIELPEGKTWDDVTDWFVKWGDVYVAFDGDEYQNLGDVGELSLDCIDFKRPDRIVAYETTDDEMPDFDKQLDERGQL